MSDPKTPPQSPINLSAALSPTESVKLTWKDNSVREDSYRIERGTDGKTFKQIDTVSANVAEYTDFGLKPGTTYYYRVRAHNSFGDSSYTNVAKVTTAGAPTPTTPNTPPVQPPPVQNPPVVQPPAPSAKPQNQICAADVAQKAGAVVVEEGFPFFLHTRGLLPASMSWVPNLPMHNFDFDWSFADMLRFGNARGRCFAGILPAGTHEGSLTITHPKSGAHGKLSLSVTVVSTPRRSVTCKSESELRAALTVARTDAHLGASFTISNSISVASLTRLFGEGYTLSSKASGATIVQPRSADGFVMRDLTIEALTTNDNDTFLSPNGTRFAVVNVMVNRALHFVNANGKPSGLLVEDVRTRDQNSIVKYLVWNDASYAVLRGLWCDNAIKEHCIRGGPQCAAYDRCYLTNVDEVNDPIMYAKGTITAHCPKDLSIDLCSCGRDGDGSRGGDIGTGPLTPIAANTPADQTSANNISMTRLFMRKGATVAIRAGTLGCRVQDCKTDFTTWNCFAISGSQKIAGVQPATDVSFVNCGVGADPTPKWNNKIVSA